MLAAGEGKVQARHVAPPLPRMAVDGVRMSQQQEKTLSRLSMLQRKEDKLEDTDEHDTARHEVSPSRRTQETEISRNLAERRQRVTTQNIQAKSNNPLATNVRSQGGLRRNTAMPLRQDAAQPSAAGAPQSLSVLSRQLFATNTIS